MNMKTILIQPMKRNDFAPFGDVIETEAAESFLINSGKCRRYHDLAKVETEGSGARTLINIFRGQPYELPLTLTMVERHPLGSQAFMPLSDQPFLVITAEDEDGTPVRPKGFMTKPGQGVNFHRNIWHGVLTSLDQTSDFLVVDRGGEGNNLEEHFFEEPYLVHALE